MYRLHSSALCDWETTEGSDRDAMVHLETEHDLLDLYTRGICDPETAPIDP